MHVDGGNMNADIIEDNTAVIKGGRACRCTCQITDLRAAAALILAGLAAEGYTVVTE